MKPCGWCERLTPRRYCRHACYVAAWRHRTGRSVACQDRRTRLCERKGCRQRVPERAIRRILRPSGKLARLCAACFEARHAPPAAPAPGGEG